jgi:type IV pilus assembly protein PilP
VLKRVGLNMSGISKSGFESPRIKGAMRGGRALSVRLAWAALLVSPSVMVLTGCSSADDELQSFIDATRHEAGGRVEPLPEVKPYQTFIYSASNLRSPFLPSAPSGGALRPDPKRNREFLEQFSLDTLKMVGTLKLGAETYGLVQTKDGLVNRVVPGNYIGQNDGRIVAISPSKIVIREIVPDGTGGYIERPAALPLSD